ncbi:MAG: glycosyltransferase family 2 protein [Candidatus Omnitrophica bacterium]|nr:glycosyltransferase family 2 protein [Candidatus Omnitrophota bacterium]
MKGKYCAVIPAFQAEKTIGRLVGNIKSGGLDVVVVDDGSLDQTAAIASKEGAFVISHLRNQGKGAALRTGFEHARRAGFDGVVTLDSDGQHDPAEIARLIEAGEHQHAGMTIGNRMINGVAMPRSRRWTNQLMSTLISHAIRQRIPDSQCGFRFIRKELLESIPLRARRFDIETELVLGAAAARWKIISVPIRSIYKDEASYIRPLRDGIRFLWLILRFLLTRHV